VSFVSDWIDKVVCELSENPPADFCQEEKWHFPFVPASYNRTTMICVVTILSVAGVLWFRKSAKKTSRKETLEEQESLCDSSSSSEDYQAVEMEATGVV